MGLNLPTHTLWRYMEGDVSTNVMNFISCTKDMVFFLLLKLPYRVVEKSREVWNFAVEIKKLLCNEENEKILVPAYRCCIACKFISTNRKWKIDG